MGTIKIFGKYKKLITNKDTAQEVKIQIDDFNGRDVLNDSIIFLVDNSYSTLRKDLINHIREILHQIVKRYWSFMDFSLITFSEKALFEADSNNISSLSDFLNHIDNLKPGGKGTDLLGALQVLRSRISKDRKNYIVIFTDGEPTTSSNNKVLSFLRTNLSNAGEFAFAAFLPDVDKSLYKKFSDAVNGSYVVVDRDKTGIDKTRNFIEALIAKELKTKVPGNIVEVKTADYGVSDVKLIDFKVLGIGNFTLNSSIALNYKFTFIPHIEGRFKVADFKLLKGCSTNCSVPLIVEFASIQNSELNEEFININKENKTGGASHRATKQMTEEELRKLQQLISSKQGRGNL